MGRVLATVDSLVTRQVFERSVCDRVYRQTGLPAELGALSMAVTALSLEDSSEDGILPGMARSVTPPHARVLPGPADATAGCRSFLAA